MLPTAATPAAGSGRWYLTTDLGAGVGATEAAAARVEQLLERHGIVVRPVAEAEGFPGGFAAAYPVLGALEDVGRVRRGYFVEGLGGIQYALPGALDRLRGGEDDGSVHLIAATDPANPFGAALPWPAHTSRPARAAGAFVVVADGRLVAFVERSGRSVLTFSDEPADLVAASAALRRLAERGARLVVGRIDGAPAATTPLGRELLAAGFLASYRGLAAPRR